MSANKKYFKVKDVANYLGLSVATIYRLIKADSNFPKGILLTKKCHLWDIEEINEWIKNESKSNFKTHELRKEV